MITDSKETFDDHGESWATDYEEIFSDGYNKLSFSFAGELEIAGYYHYYIYFENDNFKAKTEVSYHISTIKEFIENANSNLKINDMVNLFEDDAYGYDTYGYLAFRKIDALGHFKLLGMLGTSHEPFSLRFRIDVDQTVLRILATYLQKNL